MGAWGTGLYSGDFAMDLRGTIRAVARLPFSADRLVDVLCDAEPGAARSSVDSDHTVFWLVVADQFAKRGIDSRESAKRRCRSSTKAATVPRWRRWACASRICGAAIGCSPNCASGW